MIPKYDQYKKITKKKKEYGRTCGVCGHALSDCNPNDYCWCHILRGFDMENSRSLRKAYEASRDQRIKKMRDKERNDRKHSR